MSDYGATLLDPANKKACIYLIQAFNVVNFTYNYAITSGS
ncbi:hypothetical protein TUM3792_17230 [Shewanella sp. MBTL60-007]|nr:hypothetical protein TUM3792_17230 [Shewanella sp. MBTL60-007]